MAFLGERGATSSLLMSNIYRFHIYLYVVVLGRRLKGCYNESHEETIDAHIDACPEGFAINA